MKRLLAVLFALSMSGAFAIDGVLDNPNGSYFGWTEDQYWKSLDGQPLGTYPHELGDTASIVCNSNDFRFINMHQDYLPSFALDKISGGAMHCLQFVVYEGNYYTYPIQRLTLLDPDGFLGFWSSANECGRDEIVLKSVGGHEPQLSAMSVANRMGISVPEGKASVGALFGSGALYATGSGTLSIGLSPGSDANLFATNGTVEITGVAAADDANSPVPGAAVHLDASRPDALETYVGADGLTHVWKWNGVEEGGVYAVSNDVDYAGDAYITEPNTPFIADDIVSGTGLRMVDFGDNQLEPSRDPSRPINCFLQLSQYRVNAREVFFVAQNVNTRGATALGPVSSSLSFRGAINNAGLLDKQEDEISFGDIRLNGQKVSYGNVWPTRWGRDLTSVYVASVGIREDSAVEADVTLLGSYGWEKSRTGNIRLGEVLVYTNALTSSQRTRINAYLMKKWLTGAEREDFESAVLGNAQTTAAISVPEGRVARLGQVSVRGDRLVKEGGGTLSVGTLAPADAKLEIRGGTVELRAAEDVPTSAPAKDAYVWLDADAKESVIVGKVPEVPHLDPNRDYVKEWRDCRGEGHFIKAEMPAQSEWGTIYEGFKTNFPTVVSAAQNDHDVVDFGNAWGPDVSWLRLNENGQDNAYEGFLVFRFKTVAACEFPMFGATAVNGIYRSSTTKLVDLGLAAHPLGSAIWLWDGVARDPWQDYDDYAGTDFHVVSFSADKKVRVDLLAKDRIGPQGIGGLQIGEYILYDRRLTRAERKATTAYLMKKWLNRELPGSVAAAEPPRALEFASDLAVRLASEEDVILPSVVGGNGEIVKTGAGAVSISSYDFGTLKSISVEGGSLTLPKFGGLDDSSAVFHFDATVADSFEKGEGDAVTRWNDVRGNDVYAVSTIRATSETLPKRTIAPELLDASKADPTRIEVTLENGEKANVVDFGTGTYSPGASDTSSMILSEKFSNVAEIHTVFLDGESRLGQIVGDNEGYFFMRAYSGGALFSGDANAAAREGYVAVDGVVTTDPVNTVPTAGKAHLASYVPTEAGQVGAMAAERTIRAGGIRLGEQIAFPEKLSDAKRKYVEDYLMWKWGVGAVMRPLDASLDELSVVSGATLALEGGSLVADRLTGGGTLEVGQVSDVRALEVKDVNETLTVNGALVFAAGVLTIILDDADVVLEAGDYTILTATELDATRLAGIEVEGTFNRNRTATARISGNSVVLTVRKPGAAIFIR